MSPDSSSKDATTEAETERATSSVQFIRCNILKSSLLFVTEPLCLKSVISTNLLINIRRSERILSMSSACVITTV